MTRRTFLLMGLAILAVVLNHAAGWGEVAMFDWTDQYRQVSVPNYDQVGTLNDYVLLVIRQLTQFAVPAFLFGSGFFVAFAARGSRATFGWKMARVRIIDLVIPYLFWSVAWFALDAIQHRVYAPGEYISRLLTGRADGGSYYFVPLLCQFYLLSPLIVQWAKSHPRRLLALAGNVQLITFFIHYLVLFRVDVPDTISWIVLPWFIFIWAIYFPLGVICGMNSDRIKHALAPYYRPVLIAIALTGLLAFIEPEVIYRVTGKDARFAPLTLFPALYATLLTVGFVVYDQIKVPRSDLVYQLGMKSYGIYLTHLKAMEFVSRVIRRVAPSLLAHPVLIVLPVAAITGIAIPLILMRTILKSPVRKSFRYVFG